MGKYSTPPGKAQPRSIEHKIGYARQWVSYLIRAAGESGLVPKGEGQRLRPPGGIGGAIAWLHDDHAGDMNA
jgi:hypothetical protein